MPRLKTSNLKEVVISARRQRATDKAIEKERARKGLVISQRYSVIWKILYAAALDGESSASVQNLDLDDIKFFENQQLTVELQYEREQEFEELDTFIKQKKKEITELLLALGCLKIDLDELSDLDDISLELEPINEWLYKNRNLAFEYDLEVWFGNDLDTVEIVEQEDLKEFLKDVRDKSRSSKDAGRRKSLTKLGKIIGEVLIACEDRVRDYATIEKSVETQELALQTLEEETAELESKEDYLNGPDIETKHLIIWDYLEDDSLQKNAGFSSAGLVWFSSRSGQQTMENFEYAVLGLAKTGKNSMAVKCSLPVSDDTEVEIVNSSWGFRATFLSLFDFEMAMNILGYKVERKAEVGNVMGLIIKW